MEFTKLSSSGLIKLFTTLSDAANLKLLRIANNDVNLTDETCDAIIMAMKKNT